MTIFLSVLGTLLAVVGVRLAMAVENVSNGRDLGSVAILLWFFQAAAACFVWAGHLQGYW